MLDRYQGSLMGLAVGGRAIEDGALLTVVWATCGSLLW